MLNPPAGTEPGKSIPTNQPPTSAPTMPTMILPSQPCCASVPKIWNEHTTPIYQLRYYCQAEPYGPFEKDLAEDGGDIASIWQIVPDQVADLLNWGAIGSHIIERAIMLHQSELIWQKFDNQT